MVLPIEINCLHYSNQFYPRILFCGPVPSFQNYGSASLVVRILSDFIRVLFFIKLSGTIEMGWYLEHFFHEVLWARRGGLAGAAMWQRSDSSNKICKCVRTRGREAIEAMVVHHTRTRMPSVLEPCLFSAAGETRSVLTLTHRNEW